MIPRFRPAITVACCRISAAYDRIRDALDFDRLDLLVLMGLGLVSYGVAQLWSASHAFITAGAGILVFALFGLVVRLRPPR